MTGTALHHEVRGPRDRPPVVFLHGLGSSSADWTSQVGAFAARYRVILVDLPGHGASPRLPGRLTVDAMAAALERLLTELETPAAHVVGLSLGGCVALTLALGDPRRVRSLTLVNAFARLRPASPRAALRMLTRLVLLATAPMSVLAAHVARGLFPRADQRELYRAAVATLSRTSRRAYLDTMRALAGFDARRRLGDVACPSLVVTGERDRTVPPAAQEALARAIAGSRLVVVPDSGHATPHDQPAAFNRLVLEFVDAH